MNKMAILKVVLGTVGAALGLAAQVMPDGKQPKSEAKVETAKEEE